MNKLSNAQQSELIVWEYFIPTNCNWQAKTDEDVVKFFEWSEKGKHKQRQPHGDLSYFEALRQGKKWAGIHMHELYEPGILAGAVPYFTLLGGEEGKPIPREVVDFMKKEMFKGEDAETIERCYQQIIESNQNNE